MTKIEGLDEGIVWRSFEDTAALMDERTRPVLAFVLDTDGTRWPFLREILRAMPKNARLRELLAGPCAAMLVRADAIHSELAMLGAGSAYHVAVLSPSGFTPMVTFNHMTSKPDALVDEIARVLDKLAPNWA